MKSWEVLKDAVDRVGVKAVAAKLNLSAALVYKWCQESPHDAAAASGALNPLDRVREVYEVTQDPAIINWLCGAAGGHFVPNPRVEPGHAEGHLLATTQRVVENFGKLLARVSGSIENDGRITVGEARSIRQSWEELKRAAEMFVVACERGLYGDRSAYPGERGVPGR